MEETIVRDATKGEQTEENVEEGEALANIDIWKYVYGFTDLAIARCVVDLGIADVLHKDGGSMSLSELASSINCPPSTLYRLMRFLIHRKIFSQKQTTTTTTTTNTQDTIIYTQTLYTQTPLSRLLSRHEEKSMAAYIALESYPTMIGPWLELSRRVKEENNSAFDAANGYDLWGCASNNDVHNKLFNDAMACEARMVVPQIIKGCPNLFDGVCKFVDVGGGNGTTSSMLVKGYPGVQGINFDLPHVVSSTNVDEPGVQHVSGNMFESIPKADVAFIMWVLHDWGDEECIQILKKCKEAISKDKGKVIIVEAVIGENTKDKYEDVRLMLDMGMLVHTTNGKERTLEEWSYLLNKAGFSHYNVNPIHAIQSVIEAYL